MTWAWQDSYEYDMEVVPKRGRAAGMVRRVLGDLGQDKKCR
jgi:hypothetical protein